MPKVNKILVDTVDGKQIWVSPKQAAALEILEQANAGGCAAVHGYVPTTGYEQSPVVDIQMLTRFNYERLLQRKRDALESIRFEDVDASVVPDNKLAGKTREEWFELRKQQELDSIDRTLEGVRNDAHRQAHDRCYARFTDGIKVHLKTKKVDGVMQPVLENGYPTAESIMIHHLELNRKVLTEGVYKTVNSGASVLMKQAIEKVLNSRSTKIKTLSLKEDNFERLTINHNTIIPEDL